MKKHVTGIAAGLLWVIPACVQGQAEEILLTRSVPTQLSTSSLTPSWPPESGATLVNRMAGFLGACQSYYCELASTTTITGNGVDRSNGSLSRIWLRRPAHVVWTTQSDIGASALAIDGQSCTLYLPSLSKYTVTPLVGLPDAQVAAMSAPYGVLASALFASNTTSTVASLAASPPQYLGEEFVLGVLTRRVRVPVRGSDVDIWIAASNIPLPVKMASTLTIPATPGQDNKIESRTEVSFRWRVNVDLPETMFKLDLPATAQQVQQLGGPILTAALKGKDSAKPTKNSKKTEKKSESKSAKGKPSDPKDLGLDFAPPPNVDAPLALPGSPGNPLNTDGSLPSLSGRREEDVVAMAIQGSKAETVPSGASYQPQQETQAPPPPSSAAQAPGLNLPLLQGGSINLNSLRGKKAVVLDFWATWCGPCRQSLPVVSQLAQAYKARGVEFYAVNMQEDANTVQLFARQQGMSIPIAMDSDGRAASAFGVNGIPHLVVIGKNGTVTGVHTGADPNLAQTVQRDLETALR